MPGSTNSSLMKWAVPILAVTIGYGCQDLNAGMWTFDLETGAAIPGYNDVRIPGDTGDKFSLTEELEADPVPFIRLRATYSWNDKHHVSLLAAPLRFHSEGSIERSSRSINFNGYPFPTLSPLETRYRFDSYRLTYRYDFVRKENFRFGLGLTGKIRDASITVESEDHRETSSNTGFVPLINFGLAWAFAPGLALVFTGDALAAPQGRAEDVFLGLNYALANDISLKAGYRLLEGGADNDKVYTFALVNYAAAGVIISF